MFSKSYKNKKVLIMGLGLHGGGVGSARFFCAQGAQVMVTDLRTRTELAPSLTKLKGCQIRFVLGRHRMQDVKTADLIIKNPSVPADSPYLKAAQKQGIPIETDVTLFFAQCTAPLIGVTGTRGKSTVATLIAKLLKKRYPDTALVGNIGVSPLEALSRITKTTKVVIELSSFSLEDVTKSPHIAVVTNLYKDHLNRYPSFAAYAQAKKSIVRFQKKTDVAVLNYDDPLVKRFATKAATRFFSCKTTPSARAQKNFGCFFQDGILFFNSDKKALCKIEDIRLFGNHNRSNVAAAVTVAKLLGVSSAQCAAVLKQFRGVPHRQELIATKNGAHYINDTTATMPEATKAALTSTRERFPEAALILIAGGEDKQLSYQKLANMIADNVSVLVLLPGSATLKLKRALPKKNDLTILFAGSMEEAVKKATHAARSGDVVLLSPAAASFNLFKHEFDRGDKFVEAVKKLK